MSQTLFCWIWGLTCGRNFLRINRKKVTNLILLDLRSDRGNTLPQLLPSSRASMSQTLFCWIWGLTRRFDISPNIVIGVTNLILLDLRSDPDERKWEIRWDCNVTNLILLDLRSDPLLAGPIGAAVGCHKPYFVGFEVWPWRQNSLRAQPSVCHKPYFVGFEVWPTLRNGIRA